MLSFGYTQNKLNPLKNYQIQSFGFKGFYSFGIIKSKPPYGDHNFYLHDRYIFNKPDLSYLLNNALNDKQIPNLSVYQPFPDISANEYQTITNLPERFNSPSIPKFLPDRLFNNFSLYLNFGHQNYANRSLQIIANWQEIKSSGVLAQKTDESIASYNDTIPHYIFVGAMREQDLSIEILKIHAKPFGKSFKIYGGYGGGLGLSLHRRIRWNTIDAVKDKFEVEPFYLNNGLTDLKPYRAIIVAVPVGFEFKIAQRFAIGYDNTSKAYMVKNEWFSFNNDNTKFKIQNISTLTLSWYFREKRLNHSTPSF